ncbi:MAG: nucleotide pyrophosphatase/phosphodiesterase family protein [Candidatus Firestonebacteria bacterium]
MDKIIVIQIAALGYDFLIENNNGDEIEGLIFNPIESVFPSLTCTVQATFKTAELPSKHGIVGNGFYLRELDKVFFWEQSSSLINGRRIWESFRKSGKKVAQIFWQQSLGLDSDIILSPAPIHKHQGGMISDCFSMPTNIYPDLCKSLKRPFNLLNYWGPLASVKSSQWIAEATIELMKKEMPDLVLTYLPHLDYELQKSGPNSNKAKKSFTQLKKILINLIQKSKEYDYNVLIFSDYAMRQVNKTIFPNRILREKGLFNTRNVKGMCYPDLYTSSVFAVVDHQIAHIVVRKDLNKSRIVDIFKNISGIGQILSNKEKKKSGLAHSRSGDIILIAEPNSWFAYPWWDNSDIPPDFAKHVDIHNKPGYDPCELFFWSKEIKGSHGISDAESKCCWASDFKLHKKPKNLLELSREFKKILKT